MFSNKYKLTTKYSNKLIALVSLLSLTSKLNEYYISIEIIINNHLNNLQYV